MLVPLALCGCGSNAGGEIQDAGAGEGVYTSFSQIEDKRIGVTAGSVQSMQAEEGFPKATFLYFSNSTDMLNALKSKKIDAFADPDTLVKFMMSEDPSLTYIDEPLAVILVWVVARLTRRIDPKNHDPKKILEGVETHD